MIKSKVTTRGRITIPELLRKKYGLNQGRLVKFEDTETGILITPLVTKIEIKKNKGFLKTNGKLLRALMKEKLEIKP